MAGIIAARRVEAKSPLAHDSVGDLPRLGDPYDKPTCDCGAALEFFPEFFPESGDGDVTAELPARCEHCGTLPAMQARSYSDAVRTQRAIQRLRPDLDGQPAVTQPDPSVADPDSAVAAVRHCRRRPGASPWTRSIASPRACPPAGRSSSRSTPTLPRLGLVRPALRLPRAAAGTQKHGRNSQHPALVLSGTTLDAERLVQQDAGIDRFVKELLVPPMTDDESRYIIVEGSRIWRNTVGG